MRGEIATAMTAFVLKAIWIAGRVGAGLYLVEVLRWELLIRVIAGWERPIRGGAGRGGAWAQGRGEVRAAKILAGGRGAWPGDWPRGAPGGTRGTGAARPPRPLQPRLRAAPRLPRLLARAAAARWRGGWERGCCVPGRGGRWLSGGGCLCFLPSWGDLVNSERIRGHRRRNCEFVRVLFPRLSGQNGQADARPGALGKVHTKQESAGRQWRALQAQAWDFCSHARGSPTRALLPSCGPGRLRALPGGPRLRRRGGSLL